MYVVAAFPGCGKSTLADEHPEISDSDSSQFPKDDFPQNYMRHICERVAKEQCTFVSSHDVVRQQLVTLRVPFILVYPAMRCKEEYVQRYRDRAGTGKHGNKNNEEWFADLMAKNWDQWIAECEKQDNCVRIELQPGQFLADVIGFEEGQFVIKNENLQQPVRFNGN